MFNKIRSVFKRNLKLGTLLTGVAFAPLMRAQGALAGSEDVISALQLLEEMENEENSENKALDAESTSENKQILKWNTVNDELDVPFQNLAQDTIAKGLDKGNDPVLPQEPVISQQTEEPATVNEVAVEPAVEPQQPAFSEPAPIVLNTTVSEDPFSEVPIENIRPPYQKDFEDLLIGLAEMEANEKAEANTASVSEPTQEAESTPVPEETVAASDVVAEETSVNEVPKEDSLTRYRKDLDELLADSSVTISTENSATATENVAVSATETVSAEESEPVMKNETENVLATETVGTVIDLAGSKHEETPVTVIDAPDVVAQKEPVQPMPKEEENQSRKTILAILLIGGLLGSGLLSADALDKWSANRKKSKKKLDKEPVASRGENLLQDVVSVGMHLDLAPQTQPSPKQVAPIDKKNAVQAEVPATPAVLKTSENPIPAKPKRMPPRTKKAPLIVSAITTKVVERDWQKMEENANTENGRLQGLRILANNKAKRATLTQQKKALLLERETAAIERQSQIDGLLVEIAEKRKELSFERRQACNLIKGKQAKEIKELRRIQSKKMTQLRRLMKQDGLPHTDEIAEIESARIALKAVEKELLDDAKTEIKQRLQKANYLHGLRLMRETIAQQMSLDARISVLKKETGLKKKDILALDLDLRKEQQKLNAKKHQAARLIKGQRFTQQRVKLNRALKAAMEKQDIILAKEISEKLITVQQQAKASVEFAKNFNYDRQRMLLINPQTADRIRKKREIIAAQKEKLKEANYLRGQRMLYHLRNGLSTAVNHNQVSPLAYRREAERLIGASQTQFDYEAERILYLKDATVAGIYRRQKGNEHTRE